MTLLNLLIFSEWVCFASAPIRLNLGLIPPKDLKTKSFVIPYVEAPSVGLWLKGINFSATENRTEIVVFSGRVDVGRLKQALPQLLSKLPVKRGVIFLKGIKFVQQDGSRSVFANQVVFVPVKGMRFVVNGIFLSQASNITKINVESLSSRKTLIREIVITLNGTEKGDVSIKEANINVALIQKLLSVFSPEKERKIIKLLARYIALKNPFLSGEVAIKDVAVRFSNKTISSISADFSFNSTTLTDKTLGGIQLVLNGGGKLLFQDPEIVLTSKGITVSGKALGLKNPSAKVGSASLRMENLRFEGDGKSINVGAVVSLDAHDVDVDLPNNPLALSSLKTSFALSVIRKSFNISGLDLQLVQKGGGRLRVVGDLVVPENFRDFLYGKRKLNVEAKDFKLKDVVLVHLDWKDKGTGKSVFQLESKGTFGALRMEGEVKAESSHRSLALYVPKLWFSPSHARKTKPAKEKKFDFSGLKALRPYVSHIRAQVNELDIDGKLPVQSLKVKLDLFEKRADYLLSCDYCYATVGLSGSLNGYRELYVYGKVTVLSAPVDLFLSCFVRRAPVYIRGGLRLDASFEGQGDRVKGLKKSMSLKLIGEVKKGTVLKLSNIDKKLRWILDLLDLVGLRKGHLHDAVTFDRINFFLDGSLSNAHLRKFVLLSSDMKLTAFASGRLSFEPKFYKCIKGKLSFAGISKSFEVCDKRLAH